MRRGKPGAAQKMAVLAMIAATFGTVMILAWQLAVIKQAAVKGSIFDEKVSIDLFGIIPIFSMSVLSLVLIAGVLIGGAFLLIVLGSAIGSKLSRRRR